MVRKYIFSFTIIQRGETTSKEPYQLSESDALLVNCDYKRRRDIEKIKTNFVN
jgi:hypothetical protein